MLLHLVSEDEYAYYFPNASHFEEHWQDSKENPENNYHVQASLRSVFQWIEVSESPKKKISELIQNTTADSAALTAAGAAVEWHEKDGREAYDNVRAAIALLDIAYEDAVERDWNAVSLFCLEVMAALERQIGSVDAIVIERAADLIEKVIDDSDVHLGNLSDAFQLLIDNDSIVNPQGAAEKRAFSSGIKQANRLQNQGKYFQERGLLDTLIELAELLNIPIDDLENRYVEMYRRNAAQQAERGASLEAQELVRALDDQIVLDRLSDDEKEEWKSQLRSAVQSAAYELKREGAVIDSPRQRYLRQSTIQKFVHQFEHIKQVYDSGTALFWLLTHDELVPEYIEDADPSGIQDIISKTMYSLQGHLIEFDPEETDLPARYSIQAQIAMSTTVNVLSTLISTGSLKEGEIYAYLTGNPDLAAENQWYLTEIISNIFDRNDVEAIHLGASQVESILYSLLHEQGEDVDALMDEGTGTRTLGSLIPKLDRYVDEDFQQYLRYMYNEPVGQMFGGNIRNRVAHGLLRPAENNRLYSLTILFDLLRIVTRMNRSVHHARFGIPDTVLLPDLDGITITPIVIRPYASSQFPDDDSFLQYLDGGGQTVETISDHFEIPYRLALERIRLSEAVDDVQFDEENHSAELR
jgi:hypothetical protein